MVGALQYLTMTRPDITYAVHVVSQFMHAPRTTHLYALRLVFRYLRGAQVYGLFLWSSTSSAIIVAYFDANWAGSKDSYRSTTG